MGGLAGVSCFLLTPTAPLSLQVVAPVFGFLAVQVDRMGTSGREIAHRIAYDDCNESLCSKEVVHKVRAPAV